MSSYERRHRLTLQPGTSFPDGTARIIHYSRSPTGQLEVVLDHGDRRERITWVALAQRALAVRPVPPADAAEEPATPLWAELTRTQRERLTERYRDLLQVQCGSRRGNPEADRASGMLAVAYDPARTTRAQRLKTKSVELKARGDKPWSVASLYRQLEAINDGPEGLIHGNQTLAPDRLAGIDPEVLRVVRDHLIEHKHEAKVSRRKLVAMVRSDLDARSLGAELTAYKLGELIGELSRGHGLHLEAKSRETHANKPGVVYGKRRVSRPGELVQIDATTTNIHIWDGDAGWSKATVLTAIDIYTRHFLAIRVICGDATSRDVALLLWDTARPLVSRSGWPYDLDHWHGLPRLVNVVNDPDGPEQPSIGLDVIGLKPAVHPSAIVLDHGSENNSVHLLQAAARADIDVIFCPPRAPHAKGVVESAHRVLREVQSLAAAYKGASVANHPKGVEDMAWLTSQDLHDALWSYVIEVYQWEAHAGLKEVHDSDEDLCPAGVFEHYIATGGWIEAPADPFRLMTFLSSKDCKLQDYGVNVDGRVYNSVGLRDLGAALQRGIGAPTRTLTVSFDRWDTSRVYARHPLTLQWLCIPRASGRDTSQAPYSELLTRLAREGRAAGRHVPLSAEELHRREADFHSRWGRGLFADRREKRLATIEASRARDYAHDLADATEEFRSMAFGDDAIPDLANQSFPAPPDGDDGGDDDIFAYDDLEPEELAL